MVDAFGELGVDLKAGDDKLGEEIQAKFDKDEDVLVSKML